MQGVFSVTALFAALSASTLGAELPSSTVYQLQRLAERVPAPVAKATKSAGARIFESGFEPLMSLSGIVEAVAATDTELDTNNPWAPYQSNSALSVAAGIPSLGTVGGFASATGSGDAGARFAASGDQWDIFRTHLTAGQHLTLRIGSHQIDSPQANDLDLLLYDVSNTSNAAAWSITTGPEEALTVPYAGEFYVAVYANAGASAYSLTLSSSTGNVVASSKSMQAVPGEWVVLFTDSHSAKKFASHAGRKTSWAEGAAEVAVKAVGGPMVLVRIAPNAVKSRVVPFDTAIEWSEEEHQRWNEAAALKAIAATPGVRSIEPNRINRPAAAPADPLYRYQWHYPAIHAHFAWDVTLGQGAVVAVVDTGVSPHEDLNANLRGDGFDFISDPARALDGDGIDPDPSDPGDSGSPLLPSSWHGAHVAGTVAARDNSVGGLGVAPRAQILPIRVLGKDGGEDFDIAQGILYAARLANVSGTIPAVRADVINLSLGGPGSSSTLQAATDAARGAGAIVIAAAGNDASSEFFTPAGNPGVVGVSALDARFLPATYTNFGNAVDISAPGGQMERDDTFDGYPDGVLSTVHQIDGGVRLSTYDFQQGTSMAAPHVAGVAALMKSMHPHLSPDQFDSLLAGGMMTWDVAGNNHVHHSHYGHGALDAYRAVRAATHAAGNLLPGIIYPWPSVLYYPEATASLTLRVANIGDQPISIVSIAPSRSWISVGLPVSEVGALAYAVTVNRAGLTQGRHEAIVRITSDRPTITDVRAVVDVGASIPSRKNAGYLYVLAVEAATFEPRGFYSGLPDSSGAYHFAIPNLPAGDYWVIAGTDHNYDGFVCDRGEACGVYPQINAPAMVTLSSESVTLPSFPVGYRTDVTASK